MIGKILSNSPCNEDLFEGKVHEKLAKIIADEISNDPNCSIIGIDGGWGSGKSNLVGIIEQELQEQNDKTKQKYHFFTYDAWGHQNDLPRRTILEELTSDLTSGGKAIFPTKEWKERLKNLLAKQKETTTKTVPRLNFAVITIAILVALTPVISAISDLIPWTWCKLLFTIFIYVGSLAYVCIRQYKLMKKSEDDRRENPKGKKNDHEQKITVASFLAELFLVYQDKITENETYETVSEREPSTKQFNDWMNDINSSLNRINHYLVIVIDNMDRLPRIKVQELWAAIHSFFADTKYSNICVIVPFDREHIRNAFQSEDICYNNNNKDTVVVYGDDFINKTFYIVYHVAPPILSGWKDYFEHQWKLAFGEDSVIDNAVLQVYDMLTEEHSPRKIVAFINEFVTIKQLADPRIPDKYIALFIFGRKNISKKPIEIILNPNYLGPLEFLYKSDDNLPAYMSSLYYQLPIDKAMDIVYTRQFTRELDENKVDSLKQMKESGVKKFYSILDRAIAEVKNTSNAALAMAALFENEKNRAIENFWECLYQIDKQQRSVINHYLPYHKILLENISDKRMEYWKALIGGYNNSINQETNISDYIDGINDLFQVDGTEGLTILSSYHKEISPEQFVILIEETGEDYKKYGLTCSDSELSDYLEKLDIKRLASLRIIPYLDRAEYPLKSFESAIEDQLKNVGNSFNNARILICRLKELKTDVIDYKGYFNDSTLEQLYNACPSDDDFKYDLMAMRLSKMNSFRESYGYFDSDYNHPSEEMIAKVSNVCFHYLNYGSILEGLSPSSTDLHRGVCKFLTVNNVGTTLRLSIASVIQHYKTIVDNSNITSDELFVKLNRWSKYKEAITQEMMPSIDLSFFEAAKNNECEFSEYILDLAENYLESINQDGWTSALKRGSGFELSLLWKYHPKHLPEFSNALKHVMKGYATGEEKIPINSAVVDRSISVLKDNDYDPGKIFREIRDNYFSAAITTEQMRYYVGWLFEYGNLDRKKDCLNHILPSEKLNNSEIISMMAANKDIVKDMVQNSSDSTEFIETLTTLRKGSLSDNEDLKELCDYLDLSDKEEINNVDTK